MTLLDGYGYAKSGFGMASNIYGAWQTGQQYEANSLAYKRNALEETERNKASFLLQEGAKDRAGFGGAVAMDAYLWTGGQKLKSIEGQLAAINDGLFMQQSIAYEQSQAVDETVGNMMSRNAIDAMKAEARLVASAAGTGTSGGTTAVATREARSVMQFDNAVLAGRAAGQKIDIQRKMSMERVSAKNKKMSVASELSTVMGAQGAGAAYEKGRAATYAALPQSVKEGYISFDKINPEGTRTWVDDVIGYVDIIGRSDIDKELMTLIDNGDISLEKKGFVGPDGITYDSEYDYKFANGLV